MSTKQTNQGVNPAGAKSESTSASWQKNGNSARPNPSDGNAKGSKSTLSAEVMADLLAKIQDIQALWKGADSMVMADQNVLLVAFPLSGLKVGKITNAKGKEVYTVGDVPVVMAEEAK